MTLPRPTLPAALPHDATNRGLSFHRLLFARRRSGWWTPLAVAALGIVFYVVMLVVVVLVLLIGVFADPTLMDRMLALAENPAIDVADPVLFAFSLSAIVLLLPAYVLASLIVNGSRLGLISSAAGRLRWRWMLLCGLIAFVLCAVLSGLDLVIPGDGAATAPTPNPWWVVSLLVIVLIVPLQSAAEEYIFRGFLAQAIGRWLRHPAFAILLPVPLFVLGHEYDLLGQTGVGLFAVAAGWLTWRTGGLEAAIALHVANNVTGFVISLGVGTDPTAATTGWLTFLWTFLLIGGYVAVVEWLLRRKPLARTLVLTAAPGERDYAAAIPSASRIV